MLAPITPPPMITTSAEVGTVRKAEEDNGPRSHPWARPADADGSDRPAGGGGCQYGVGAEQLSVTTVICAVRHRAATQPLTSING
ncbi:hypothetical protein GCM10010307_20500 [Streptomyces vastus]|uniref:Uncharacterized protein n=1 Tax=Streptomyces vastus TaxID=285451 RepID=A0ABN3QMB2_9ACTN